MVKATVSLPHDLKMTSSPWKLVTAYPSIMASQQTTPQRPVQNGNAPARIVESNAANNKALKSANETNMLSTKTNNEPPTPPGIIKSLVQSNLTTGGPATPVSMTNVTAQYRGNLNELSTIGSKEQSRSVVSNSPASSSTRGNQPPEIGRDSNNS